MKAILEIPNAASLITSPVEGSRADYVVYWNASRDRCTYIGANKSQPQRVPLYSAPPFSSFPPHDLKYNMFFKLGIRQNVGFLMRMHVLHYWQSIWQKSSIVAELPSCLKIRAGGPMAKRGYIYQSPTYVPVCTRF